MPFSPNLNIEHLQPNSDQPEVVVNAAIDANDAAITGVLAYPIDATNILTLTKDELAAQFTIQLTAGGISAIATVNFPANARGDLVIDNQSGFDCDIGISGQALAKPRVPNGRRRRVWSDGVNVSDPSDGSLPTYTVATLPAAGVSKRRAWVSDALAPAFGSAVVAGGAVLTPVYDTGAAWFCG